MTCSPPRRPAALFLLLPLSLLAACDGAQEEAVEEGADASGEVLEGSISDDMLPVDTLRSQPPLMRQEPAGDDASSSGDAADGTDEGADEGAADGAEDAGDGGEAPAADPAEPASGEEEPADEPE